MLKKTVTDKLLDELNAKKKLVYPQVGYFYFADIRGDGRNIRSVYQITSPGGGVCYAHELNDISSKKRCEKIRAAIQAV